MSLRIQSYPLRDLDTSSFLDFVGVDPNPPQCSSLGDSGGCSRAGIHLHTPILHAPRVPEDTQPHVALPTFASRSCNTLSQLSCRSLCVLLVRVLKSSQQQPNHFTTSFDKVVMCTVSTLHSLRTLAHAKIFVVRVAQDSRVCIAAFLCASS